jgi:transcriptional regulator with XRE-family HTH domain
MKADTLANLMKKKGITAYQIERSLGISEGAVRGWLKGNTPRADHLLKVADMLEVEPRSLIMDETPVSSEARLLAARVTEFCWENPEGIDAIKKILDLFIETYKELKK